MQLQQEPVRPREIIPTIPLGLEQVTIRAMQKTPQSRYRSAAEMLMDINEFKRNPSIKFNYSYFVDQEPTKYIRTNNNDTLVRDTRHFNVEKQEEPDEGQSSNKTSAVLIGAIAGLLVIAAVIVGIFVGNKNKKIDVPNFIGKNFHNEVKGNDEYEDFEFVTEYTKDPNKENGTITAQNPDKDGFWCMDAPFHQQPPHVPDGLRRA
jgi:serine/threonine-protein kinase